MAVVVVVVKSRSDDAGEGEAAAAAAEGGGVANNGECELKGRREKVELRIISSDSGRWVGRLKGGIWLGCRVKPEASGRISSLDDTQVAIGVQG